MIANVRRLMTEPSLDHPSLTCFFADAVPFLRMNKRDFVIQHQLHQISVVAVVVPDIEYTLYFPKLGASCRPH